MSSIVLIRPGCTDYDEQSRLLGALEMPMNDAGLEQVQAIIRHLQQNDIKLEAIFASPLAPASSTARAIVESQRGVKVKELEELRNVDQGLWQGLPEADVRKRYPRVFRKAGEKPQTIGPPAGEASSEANAISRDIALMGHAMQLSYLGRESGVKVPPVFNAWISDAVIEDATKKAVEVRVLLTKNQLSDMYQVVKSITDAVLEGMISPDNFFSQLRSAAATLGRDPNQINQSQNAKLSELGLLGEYLEDLPYHSFILGLDQEAWAQLGPHQQDAILKDLNKKLKYYEYSNDDSDRWVSLAEGSDPADYVYPVPIEMLP